MAGIVVGNLAVDVRGFIPSADELSSFSAGHDVLIAADSIVAMPGGSGFMFARSLILRGADAPLLLGCVGNDGAGDLLIRQLEVDGILTNGIGRTDSASTSTVMLTYLPDGTRLLVRPRAQANAYFSPALVDQTLGNAGSDDYEYVWLSGYALVDAKSDSRLAVKAVCDWARRERVRTFVDLVPHAFRTTVGDLTYLLNQLGMIDGVVAELDTYSDLGYCSKDAVLSAPQQACEEAVRSVSKVVNYAVAQHRINARQYVQVLATRGTVVSVSIYPIEDRDLRGMGDLMSVDALRFFGVLR